MEHKLNQLESSIYKCRQRGWTAKSSYEVDGGIYSGRCLDVNTYKQGSNLVSTVSISEIEKQSNGVIIKKFLVFQSPYRKIISTHVSRVTNKVVEAQHNQALEQVFAFNSLKEVG